MDSKVIALGVRNMEAGMESLTESAFVKKWLLETYEQSATVSTVSTDIYQLYMNERRSIGLPFSLENILSLVTSVFDVNESFMEIGQQKISLINGLGKRMELKATNQGGGNVLAPVTPPRRMTVDHSNDYKDGKVVPLGNESMPIAARTLSSKSLTLHSPSKDLLVTSENLHAPLSPEYVNPFPSNILMPSSSRMEVHVKEKVNETETSMEGSESNSHELEQPPLKRMAHSAPSKQVGHKEKKKRGRKAAVKSEVQEEVQTPLTSHRKASKDASLGIKRHFIELSDEEISILPDVEDKPKSSGSRSKLAVPAINQASIISDFNYFKKMIRPKMAEILDRTSETEMDEKIVLFWACTPPEFKALFSNPKFLDILGLANDGDSERFEVEEIVSHNSDISHFEILWKGFENTTWEAVESLKNDIPSMLIEYAQKYNL